MFPKWQGEIDLPPLPERKLVVGSNWVIQNVFAGGTFQAKILDAQFPGHDLVLTELEPPYREFLLRRKGARRITASLPVVAAPTIDDPNAMPPCASVQWEALGELETYADTPEKILAAWTNKFDFRTENEAAGLPGLRTPQIGALHAISAHFAVGAEFDAATVVLPTGTGKTEAMLPTLVYRQLPSALALVPSDALRGQIAKKFVSLGVLPTAKVVPAEIARPRVAVISTGVKTMDESRTLIENANVIVALPNSLKASDEGAIAHLIEQCTDLIVDEAHHVTTDTWATVRECFNGKRILQFTATPFRRDKERIDGKIIFN
jgi:hypothetical protein